MHGQPFIQFMSYSTDFDIVLIVLSIIFILQQFIAIELKFLLVLYVIILWY